MVANPFMIGGVNALSDAPQIARSASPERRNMAPRMIECPPEAQAFAVALLQMPIAVPVDVLASGGRKPAVAGET